MDINKAVADLMSRNSRVVNGYRYTLPSSELYPFQWLWDSCFHAIILSKYDVESAKEELRSVTKKPLSCGMLPHINYWRQPKDTVVTNWGREKRGDVIDATWGTDGTSSITQPPLMAKALWRVYHAVDKDVDFLKEIYPVLFDHHTYLINERDLNGDGLLFIINPDESGEDNSPRFDISLGLEAVHTSDDHLDRRISLVHKNLLCKFDSKTYARRYFAVIDVAFNIIYLESLQIMALIAQELGRDDETRIFKNLADRVRLSLRSMLSMDGSVRLYSYDLLREKFLKVNTWNLFMPLYGGLLDSNEASILVDCLKDERYFWTNFPIPTVARNSACYDPDDGFWRGPVWMAPNWFIYKGLMRYGYIDLATELAEKTRKLITLSGFREYYHPTTGEGLGAKDFTWGGLVTDMTDHEL